MESQKSARRQYLIASTATWLEVKDYLRRHPTAILPLGSLEQHGPHLPLFTDSLLAEELAKRVAQKSVGLVLPVLPIGYSWVWRDHPGTLTLSLNTFIRVVKDIACSLDRYGTRALLVITGHGANQEPLKYTVRELVDEIDLAILYVFYPSIQEIILKDLTSPPWHERDFHADEIETSLLLAVRPDLCQMDKAVREYPPIPEHYRCSALSMGQLSQSGVFGDALSADVGKGKRWLEAISEKIAQMWMRFLESHGIKVNP